MKKLFVAVISIALVLGLVGGGYFAYFQDTETSSDNNFTAGILDMAVDCEGDTTFSATDSPLPLIFDYLPVDKPIAPGDSGEVTLSLHLKEATTINADLWMQVTDLVNIDEPNPEPEVSETLKDETISDEILTKVWLDDGDNILEAGETVVVDGTLDALIALGKFPVDYNVAGGQTRYVGWSWELPTSVGNESQGDTCTFNITFGADQVTSYLLSTSVDPSGSVLGGGTKEANTTATVTAIPAEGYSFSYWTGPVNNTATNPTNVFMDGPKSVTAHFVINQYTISFESNGGSAVTAITQDFGTAVSAPAAPTKAGNTFAGWYSDAGLTTPYTFTTMPAANITLYAKWTVNQYTISFNSNGGSAVTAITQDFGTAVSAPAAPTKAGNTFAGWYSDAGLTTPYTFTTMPAANITLYAKWTVNQYTISFNSNGGSAVTAITQDFGTAVSAPTAPTKAGNTFAGWYSDAGLTTPYTFTTMPAANITLYAKWTVNQYTISFNSNGGSAVTAITQDFGTAVSAPAAPTKAGNTFAGWYSDAGLTTPYTFTTLPAANITLYAKWTVSNIDVSLNPNAGEDTTGSVYNLTGGDLALMALSNDTNIVTTTAHLTPVAGTDTTSGSGSYTLTSSDLSAVATSNDGLYTTDSDWYSSYTDDDVLDFSFGDIPESAVVTGATLHFEWRWNESSILNPTVQAAQIRIYDGATWTPHTLTVPSEGSDSNVTISLPEINTAAKANAMIVRFQADASSSSNVYTQHDWVQVDVDYSYPSPMRYQSHGTWQNGSFTANLVPTGGTDTTASGTGSYSLNASNLSAVANSNDARYTTASDWDSSYTDNDVLDFSFGDIPDSAVVAGALLRFEWQWDGSSGTFVNSAQIRVHDGSSWTTHALTLPSENTDTTATIILSEINTAAKANAMIVRFQADASSNSNVDTTHDWVQVEVSYTASEHLDLAFPDIPSGATVNSAALNFEWQRTSDVSSATLYISSNDGSSWTASAISPLPTAGSDSTITLNLVTLFGIDTAAEFNGLKVRLQANGASGNPITLHDWVQVNVNYTP